MTLLLSLPPDNPALRRFLRDVWAREQRASWVHYVDTQSMTPSLHGPVDLLVQWGTSLTLHPGDLIVFEDPVLNILVAHRVCQVDTSERPVLQTGDRLFVRGIPGNWLDAEALFGRVLALRSPATSRVVRLDRPGIAWVGRQIARSSARFWQQRDSGSYPMRAMHHVWCWAYQLSLILFQEGQNASDLPLPQI